jgi:hypothetical protein
VYDFAMSDTMRAAVGYAADGRGEGVAYVRVFADRTPRVLRVPFSAQRYPGLQGREIGYAALHAVAQAVHRRGLRRVHFEVDDDSLRRDLAERRELPAALTVPYVRLRCALNAFERYGVGCTADGDLAARARSEIAMHAAA